MKHNVILVLLDGLNGQVARHATGHLHGYVEAGRVHHPLAYARSSPCDLARNRLGATHDSPVRRELSR